MPLTTKNIETLLALCKKGNRLAQLEVYNRYYRAMYNSALRIVKNAEEAEDIMQESFLTAFEKLDSYKGEADFGAWLKRIVINNSIKKYRRQQDYAEITESSLKTESNAESALTEEELSHLKTVKVMDAVNSLKSSYREILMLYYFEGFDYEEITEILQLSYGSCRTMLSRAKESLRKKLTGI